MNLPRTNPIYFLLPATLACCHAFMLPVAAPPNAIVYDAAGMTTWDMLSAGAMMNIAALVINMVAINTYGTYIFGLDTVPAWANRTVAVGGVYIGHGLDHIGHNVHVGE